MCPSGTNINEAMLTAVKLLESNTQAELLPEGSISLIILLTDGDPTVGEGTAGRAGNLPRENSWAAPACCVIWCRKGAR